MILYLFSDLFEIRGSQSTKGSLVNRAVRRTGEAVVGVWSFAQTIAEPQWPLYRSVTDDYRRGA